MTPTGNIGFDAAVSAAESNRQSVIRTLGVTQAQAAAADVAYFTAVVNAGIAFGIATPQESIALIELGAGQIPTAN